MFPTITVGAPTGSATYGHRQLPVYIAGWATVNAWSLTVASPWVKTSSGPDSVDTYSLAFPTSSVDCLFLALFFPSKRPVSVSLSLSLIFHLHNLSLAPTNTSHSQPDTDSPSNILKHVWRSDHLRFHSCDPISPSDSRLSVARPEEKLQKHRLGAFSEEIAC